MASIKIYGTIIHFANYRENDKMLTLLTPNMGIVSVLSRGCKRPKSVLLQASELFVTGEFVLYENNGRYTLTSASVENYFYDLRTDAYKLSCGVFLLQLCKLIIQENEECESIYTVLLQALNLLSNSSNIPELVIVNAFIFPFLNYSGYKPRFKHCIHCGKRIDENSLKIAFDSENGGCVCNDCDDDSVPKISKEEYLEILRYLSSNSLLKSVKNHAQIKTQKSIFALLCNYIEIQLQYKFKSAKFLLV